MPLVHQRHISDHSPYSLMRIQEEAIYRGPKSIVIPIPNSKGHSFYGWPILSLEANKLREGNVESRSIYANLLDKTQSFAILRSVIWNRRSTKEAIKEHGGKHLPSLPARFIKIPAIKLEAWLLELDRLKTSLPGKIEDDDGTSLIRRLRIEIDYTGNIYERVWQGQNKSFAKLNRKWDGVWLQMTKCLTLEPSISDLLEEDFWFVKPRVRYNFRDFKSLQFD